MSKRTLATIVLAGALALVGAQPALADTMPTPGPDFGTHLASMTPQHPIDYGVTFGQCVGTMAQGSATCPCS